ncbi:hypothetical protein BMETH_1589_0 [methanotrophic bacterial endosymbiont of Bathymodiolus sp.]|nr:hypothetical protein BMETH_1589_0 [methanotrophic bacterial endosymbiont of Bathymodiolus sp.]
MAFFLYQDQIKPCQRRPARPDCSSGCTAQAVAASLS